jgi:hypothetical protein
MKIHHKIFELLNKRGIQKVEELTPEERAEVFNWQSQLDGTEITVEKIEKFCESQIRIIEDKYASGDQTDKQDMFLRASLHIYLNIQRMIKAPETERVNIEKYLTQLISEPRV